MSPDIFDESVMAPAREAAKASSQQARRRSLTYLRNGASGREVIKALKRYENALQQATRKIFRRHSKHFLLNQFRIVLGQITLKIMSTTNWEQEHPDDLLHEISAQHWLCIRITLAILKYGNPETTDMEKRLATLPGLVSISRPTDISHEDAVALITASFLMTEYDEVRYRLKRAGKGARFIWKNRKAHEFDLILEGDAKILVERYDERSQIGENMLMFAGTWAPLEVYHDFPLPGGCFTPVSPIPQAHKGRGGAISETSVMLTLVPNIAGQGIEFGWPFIPFWLFQWIPLEPLLPRVELFRGLFKKHLELVRRQPGFELEDLFFALSAISHYQITASRKNEHLWANIMSKGYCIISSDHRHLKQEILPEFTRIRQKFGGGASSEEDWLVMNAVFDHITWDKRKCNDINMLNLSPNNLIYRVDKGSWLIDWTMMQRTIFDVVSVAGTMSGTVARLRGHEFEEILGGYLASRAAQLDISIWWRGRYDRKLRFREGMVSDADVIVLVDNYLIIIEAKAHALPRELLLVGDPERLNKRWEEVVQVDLQQVDELAESLQLQPHGLNFQIPDVVDWIVPVVCTTACEWIPSLDRKWWLFDDIPRVCTLSELMEIIGRVKIGVFPQYKLPVAT